MRTILIGLLSLFLAGPALAQGERGSAQVTLTPETDALLVTIQLDRPVERLSLEQADVVRDDALQIDTPGLAFAENAITGNEPFDRVALRLNQDLTERDAKYPALYHVGAGHMIYLQSIYPDLSVWDTSIAWTDIPEGWVRWPDVEIPLGYVFVGPADMIEERQGLRFVFDENSDPDFRDFIRETAGTALAHLENAFGSAPAHAPFIATNRLSGEQSRLTGDVTDNAMIGLRFSGDEFDPSAAGSAGITRGLILHEGVHFWNGGVATFAQGSPQWLHEGGAEYIATIASMRIGWTSREDVQRSIARWLGNCSTSLRYSDEVALDDLSFIPASLRYSCGPLLHVLAELYLADGDGDGDADGDRDNSVTVTQGWAITVRQAAATDGEYTLDEFLSALGEPYLLERPALSAILATSGSERWAVVHSELARLGVEIGQASSAPLRARTVLMHLVRGQCTELSEGQGYGFYSQSDAYRLDTPEGCGLLTGNPHIVSLNGMSLFSLSEQDYFSLQQACRSSVTITFGRADGPAIDVPCTSPLADAATEPYISALPDIAGFATTLPANSMGE